MKIAIRPNGLDRTFEIQTEKPEDFYTIGRIAAKFKKQASNYPDGQKTVELDITDVLLELAK